MSAIEMPTNRPRCPACRPVMEPPPPGRPCCPASFPARASGRDSDSPRVPRRAAAAVHHAGRGAGVMISFTAGSHPAAMRRWKTAPPAPRAARPSRGHRGLSRNRRAGAATEIPSTRQRAEKSSVDSAIPDQRIGVAGKWPPQTSPPASPAVHPIPRMTSSRRVARRGARVCAGPTALPHARPWRDRRESSDRRSAAAIRRHSPIAHLRSLKVWLLCRAD